MKKVLGKRYLWLPIILMFLASLAMVSVPVQSSSTVRIYVKMPPEGYILGVPAGSFVHVHLNIESPFFWDDTPQGIVQWAISVKVDPTVLEPLGVLGARAGYFLYDFAVGRGWDVRLWPPIINKEAGTMEWITETIVGPTPILVGAGGSGRLVTLVFKPLSADDYSPIDLFYDAFADAYYWTAEGVEHPVDVVEDGHYNLIPVPEFPLGSVAPIALIAAVAYVWWIKKQKTPKVMYARAQKSIITELTVSFQCINHYKFLNARNVESYSKTKRTNWNT